MGALLTEPEVAERLRCSIWKIKRLRRARKLAYLPGRPVLIDEDDLLEYIEDVKREKIDKLEQAAAEKAAKEAAKNSPAAAAQLARKIWTLRRLRAEATPKPKPKPK